MKKKIYLILIMVFIIILSLVYNYNLLNPYYYFKDLVISPISYLKKDEKILYDNNYYESIIMALKDDINELKEISNISNTLTDFNYINATVIERNRDYWFNTITINKGKIDGIEEDMAVIDKKGLIGRISKVRRNTSDVKLITTNDVTSKISVVIKDKLSDIFGIITGYDIENNLLKVNIIGKKEINKDSLVETTGIGGIFPKGILIGKVYDTKISSDDVSIIVRVKPISNIMKEEYVAILKRNNDNN